MRFARAKPHQVTGFASNEATLGGKWLELLSEIAPGLKRAAIMFNPDTAPVSTYMPSFEMAARLLKVEPITAPVHSDVEIETAIIALGREPGGGLVVFATPRAAITIISAAARNNVPAVPCGRATPALLYFCRHILRFYPFRLPREFYRGWIQLPSA